MAAIIAKPADAVASFLLAGLMARSHRDTGTVLVAAINEWL
ncbi:hypothetical protein [Kitasatospora sp. NA04385]|nr:hypothetical protein [Kitasatospora sp. NA04385]